MNYNDYKPRSLHLISSNQVLERNYEPVDSVLHNEKRTFVEMWILKENKWISLKFWVQRQRRKYNGVKVADRVEGKPGHLIWFQLMTFRSLATLLT